MSNPAPQTETLPFLQRFDENSVAWLTLNRPDQYNPLSQALLKELQGQLEAIADDDSVRVVVLAAGGKAFSAGHDLREMNAMNDDAARRDLFELCNRVMLTLTRIPQPVIACVQGVAAAGGCQLVAACDLAVATSEARFATSGINLGLFCNTPGVPLSRVMTRKRALEMLFTGDFISADTAQEWGLINRVVAADELQSATTELAEHIAAKSRDATAIGKRTFYRQIDRDLETAYEIAGQAMVENMAQPDTVEGIDAFVNKRQPQSK